MSIGRTLSARILMGLLVLVLVACAGQPVKPDATPEATAEATTDETAEATQEPTEPADTPEETPEDTPEATEDEGGGDGDDEYVRLEHEDAEMVVEAPARWDDTDTDQLWEFEDEIVGYLMMASPDIEGFQTGPHDVPGVLFAASETIVGEFTPDEVLDEHNLAECDYDGREDYSDPVYTGVLDTYTNCAGTETRWYFISAEADDGSHIVFVQVAVVADEDEEAYERVLDTFLARDLPELDE